MVLLWGTWPQRGGCEDRTEKEPRPKFAGHNIGMLALPADPRGLSQRLLHHRRRVDEDLHARTAAGRKIAGDSFELALDDIVVIEALRVDRDCGVAAPRDRCQGICVRAIARAEHDDRADIGPQHPRIGPAVRLVREPCHSAVESRLQKGEKPAASFANGIR